MNVRPSPSSDHVVKASEVEIDLGLAPPSRIADYVNGGDANFTIDREVADEMFASVPGGVEGYRAVARAGQAFLERVVRHLTAEAGLRQYLVTGCRISGSGHVHEIAQSIAPECRVVYLVLDPVELAHAHELRSRTAEGVVAHIQSKLRDTDAILGKAAATLDLSRPVGVLLPATLGFVRNDETAYRITSGLMAGVPSGSHLMLTHQARDFFVESHAEMYRTIDRLAAEGKTWWITPRTSAEVAKFFDGLDILEPGVVPMDEWRLPGGPQERFRGANYGAVGRKA